MPDEGTPIQEPLTAFSLPSHLHPKMALSLPLDPKLALQVVFDIREILFYFILAISRVISCHGSVGAEQMQENKNDKEERERALVDVRGSRVS